MMDLKEIKKWCEALPANAEVRPIILGLITELEALRKERSKVFSELPMDWSRTEDPGGLPGFVARLTEDLNAEKEKVRKLEKKLQECETRQADSWSYLDARSS